MKYLLTLLAALTGCRAFYHPAYPLTAEYARDGIYRIEAYTDGVLLGSGTAWATTTNEVVTAGHVCAAQDRAPNVTFSLSDAHGGHIAVTPERYSDDPDLCLLKADRIVGRPLLVASQGPRYGAPIEYIGAPLGVYGDGVAPIFLGQYINSRMVSAPVAPGASGAPVFTQEGVFGVVVAVDRQFHHLSYIVPLNDLKGFLKGH